MKRTALYFVLAIVQCISIINGDTDNIVVPPEEYCALKNSLDFTGKVVIISGSSSGMGAQMARVFSSLGARVVVSGRNETRIKEVVHDCLKLSPYDFKPLGIKLDLSIPGNVAKLVNETIKAYKKIDVGIYNAGIGNFATILDPNFNEVNKGLKAINEEATVELARLTAPYIMNTNGSLIFIASILARNPVLSTGGYSMGKNAIIALANTLTHDLGPNVRVNVISPGIVDGTRIFRLLPPLTRPTLIEKSSAASALQRPGYPMDIAKTAVFLASPLASFITGQELRLDGGAYVTIL